MRSRFPPRASPPAYAPPFPPRRAAATLAPHAIAAHLTAHPPCAGSLLVVARRRGAAVRVVPAWHRWAGQPAARRPRCVPRGEEEHHPRHRCPAGDDGRGAGACAAPHARRHCDKWGPCRGHALLRVRAARGATIPLQQIALVSKTSVSVALSLERRARRLAVGRRWLVDGCVLPLRRRARLQLCTPPMTVAGRRVVLGAVQCSDAHGAGGGAAAGRRCSARTSARVKTEGPSNLLPSLLFSGLVDWKKELITLLLSPLFLILSQLCSAL